MVIVRSHVARTREVKETYPRKLVDKTIERMAASHQAATKVNAQVAPKVRSPRGRTRNRRVKVTWVSRNWMKRLTHFGGVVAAAWGQGHIKRVEKPSSSRGEILGIKVGPIIDTTRNGLKVRGWRMGPREQ